MYMTLCSFGKFYIFHGRFKTSSIVEQSQDTNHHICIEDAKVIATEDHYNKRPMREAIKIGKNPPNLNIDDGLDLWNSWKLLIQILTKSENS